LSSLSVSLGDIHLKNPVITCSGTFASGLEFNNFYDIEKIGAITTKSYTLKPRKGNPPPRLCETYGGLINSIGLQNEGIDHFLKNELKKVKERKACIILSIAGTDAKEFSQLSKKVSDVQEDLIAVELNLSCPNVKKGGMTLGACPENVESITCGVSDILAVPLIVKLSPNNDNLDIMAKRAKDGGAQAVSLINTIPAMAIDTDTFRPKLGNVFGGLSGPAIKPVAVAKIFKLHQEDILPIIGMGGVFDHFDAIEFMLAGASAVGVGTANFIDPNAASKILEGISSYMLDKNIINIKDIIGKVRLD
jgi:dihydroorotate dehydrogenase (NAD+) catalytic subunit